MASTTAPRPTRSRRPLGMSLATAMIVTLAPVAGFTLAPAGATTSTPSASWGDCPTDVAVTNTAGVAAKCTTITVPMDYANPAAGTFKILATGFFPTGTPKGVIFGNPGGPGGSALDFWGKDAGTPAEMYRDYALIGLQPRGLEHATSAVCSTVEECRAKADEAYRKTLTTENIARDMDELRKAMGLDKISYYGASWGTQLGATYATLFPSNVDKMVLDSNINPATLSAGGGMFAKAESTLAFERRLYDFFDWAATNNKVFGLGDTPYKVYSAWNTARLVENPKSWIDNYLPPPLREADLPQELRPLAAKILPDLNTVIQGVTKRDYAERLAAAAAAKADTVYSTDTPAYGQQAGSITLAGEAMMYNRQLWSGFAGLIDMTLRPLDFSGMQSLVASGKISAEEFAGFTGGLAGVSAAGGLQGGMRGYQGPAVNAATGDAAKDSAAARNPDPKLIGLRDAAAKAYKDAIAAGESSASIRSKFQVYEGYGRMISGSVTPLQFSGTGLTTAPLLLQSLGDPATTASGGRVLAEQLGGKLITVDGGDHGTFRNGSTVLDQAVLRYLATGKVDITTAPEAPATVQNFVTPIRKLLSDNGILSSPVVGPTIPDTPLNRILSLMGPNVDTNSIVPKPTFAAPSTPANTTATSQTTTAAKEPAPALAASAALSALPTAASTPDTTTAAATAPTTSTPKPERPTTETSTPTPGTATTGTTTGKTDTAPSTDTSTPAATETGAPSTTDKTTESTATEKTTEKSAATSEPTEKAAASGTGSSSGA